MFTRNDQPTNTNQPKPNINPLTVIQSNQQSHTEIPLTNTNSSHIKHKQRQVHFQLPEDDIKQQIDDPNPTRTKYIKLNWSNQMMTMWRIHRITI